MRIVVDQEIGISTVAPAALLRQGFAPKDFRRGDSIEVFYHPARDGSLSLTHLQHRGFLKD